MGRRAGEIPCELGRLHHISLLLLDGNLLSGEKPITLLRFFNPFLTLDSGDSDQTHDYVWCIQHPPYAQREHPAVRGGRVMLPAPVPHEFTCIVSRTPIGTVSIYAYIYIIQGSPPGGA